MTQSLISRVAAAIALSVLLVGGVFASENPTPSEVSEAAVRQDDRLILNELAERRMDLSVGKDYVWGLHKYRLDHETEMLGWQVSDRWFFGRQRGEDSGLTLVWQEDNNQMSLSKDGLRLTRRF